MQFREPPPQCHAVSSILPEPSARPSAPPSGHLENSTVQPDTDWEPRRVQFRQHPSQHRAELPESSARPLAPPVGHPGNHTNESALDIWKRLGPFCSSTRLGHPLPISQPAPGYERDPLADPDLLAYPDIGLECPLPDCQHRHDLKYEVTHLVRPRFYPDHFNTKFLGKPYVPTPRNQLEVRPLIECYSQGRRDPPPQLNGIRRLPPPTGNTPPRAPRPPEIPDTPLIEGWDRKARTYRYCWILGNRTEADQNSLRIKPSVHSHSLAQICQATLLQ